MSNNSQGNCRWYWRRLPRRRTWRPCPQWCYRVRRSESAVVFFVRSGRRWDGLKTEFEDKKEVLGCCARMSFEAYLPVFRWIVGRVVVAGIVGVFDVACSGIIQHVCGSAGSDSWACAGGDRC